MRLVFEEYYKIIAVTGGVADPTTPTVDELTGGSAVDVTPYITKDGVAPGISENAVDAADISTAYDAEDAGSWGSQLSLTYFLDDETDAAENLAWDTFVRGWVGAIVVLPFLGSDEDPIDGTRAYVWPDSKAGQRQLPTSAKNERQKSTTRFFVGSEPQFEAVVGDPT